ncbi:endolytic transglycosylase MltG [Candidatus Poribacteria bacterium]|nr:endolytic transglycosylase MltG [Candidatus Poribacteria bacterium]
MNNLNFYRQLIYEFISTMIRERIQKSRVFRDTPAHGNMVGQSTMNFPMILRGDATCRVSPRVNRILFSIAIGSIMIIFIILRHFHPVDAKAKPIQLKIILGMSSKTIAQQLARAKLIRNPLIFQLAAYVRGASCHLRAGTYQLSAAMPLIEIIDHLKTGRFAMNRFVIPEGLTLAQIEGLWEREGYGTAAEFHQVARDPQWCQEYAIKGDTVEGYLFPNTYQISEGTPPRQAIKMMLNEFNRQWTPPLREEAKSLGLSIHEVITLASIIEKEAKCPDERPLISAVFHNRLRLGWRLDADVTVLYALGNPKRPLTTADLSVDSPYNTYIYKGLPPGPICNPGMASIQAALRPASVPYLYFVAVGDGRHYFSTTLNEHQDMIHQIKRDVN